MLLDKLLGSFIRFGDLTIIDADGRRYHYGQDVLPGTRPSTIRLHRAGVARKLATHPSLALGEAYMDGTLTVEEGDLYNFLSICLQNMARSGRSRLFGWIDRGERLLRPLFMHNPVSRSRRNVAHHYDLSKRLYELFLDSDWQYSCAYFDRPNATLDEAQTAKKRHIAAKLLLRPGQHVLDIGCGWGGLALSLARWAGVTVTGITLSEEQLKVARARAEAGGLAGRVTFELQDYRLVEGSFDRIVSVGMFEHVGVGYYEEFFDAVGRLLTDDGVALLHSIGRVDGPGVTNPWVRKHIFPGGYVPALSEVLPAVERKGLFLTDMEILRLHYAETLKEWRRKFRERWDDAKRLYDERFCRIWEFYLAGSEASFRYDNLMVFQMQLAKAVDTVPITREYITDSETLAAGLIS